MGRMQAGMGSGFQPLLEGPGSRVQDARPARGDTAGKRTAGAAWGHTAVQGPRRHCPCRGRVRTERNGNPRLGAGQRPNHEAGVPGEKQTSRVLTFPSPSASHSACGQAPLREERVQLCGDAGKQTRALCICEHVYFEIFYLNFDFFTCLMGPIVRCHSIDIFMFPHETELW